MSQLVELASSCKRGIIRRFATRMVNLATVALRSISWSFCPLLLQHHVLVKEYLCKLFFAFQTPVDHFFRLQNHNFSKSRCYFSIMLAVFIIDYVPNIIAVTYFRVL